MKLWGSFLVTITCHISLTLTVSGSKQVRQVVTEPLPNWPAFGAVLPTISIQDVLNSTVDQQKRTVSQMEAALHQHKLLLLTDQNITPLEQIQFGELFGALYNQSNDVNRKQSGRQGGDADPRIAVFSNDPRHGAVAVGVEGFHVDGNVAPVPHKMTMIYCEQAVEGGDTLFASLGSVVAALSKENREFLDTVYFRSAHVRDNVHPLIYPHPTTGKDTMMFGLGSLSGRYLQSQATKDLVDMTMEETRSVIQTIEDTIQAVGSYRHQWQPGSLLVVDNLALAHLATAGTQSLEHGVRIMRRTTVLGVNSPRKREPKASFPHQCAPNLPVCLVSLANYVNYTTLGKFHTRDQARELCKYALHPDADLAVLEDELKNDLASELIRMVKEPHWIGADEHESAVMWLDGSQDTWSSPHPWDKSSGQPNDCSGPGSEPCVFIGPEGKWFDFACAPKTRQDETPGPEITWTDGSRRMYNVHPMCQAPAVLFQESASTARSEL